MSIGGLDWPLMAWITVAAIVLAGGALAFLHGVSFRARRWGKHLSRRRSRGTIAVLVVVAAVTAAASQAQPQRRQTPAGSTAAAYSRDVFRICAGAVLFEGSHALGTRQGTLDAAADIRASTQRRLAEVARVPTPADEARTIARWLAVEQQLADAYAQDLVQLYDLIATVSTSADADRASQSMRAVTDASYPIRLAAGRLELKLGVPDCTGD